MNCYICNKRICEHGRRRHYASGKIECLDCELITYELEPMLYSLPFYEGVVNWHSKVYFPVCHGCYVENTLLIPCEK